MAICVCKLGPFGWFDLVRLLRCVAVKCTVCVDILKVVSERNGGTGENENQRRLDQMADVIQSMITLTLEQGKMNTLRHEQIMEEIRDLITLQKEQRIDIMALFEGNKTLRQTMEEYFKRHP